MQRQTKILIFLLIACIMGSRAEDCNLTHYQFFSKYSLGKQDQLNKTFDQLLPKLKIPDVTYKFSDILSFNLTDIRVRFFYKDSQQKAQIVGRDTIFIYGGKLNVEVDFKWTKVTLFVNTNGTGSARANTDEIMFEKLLQLDQGYLDYKLEDALPVTMLAENLTLFRIDPPLQDESQKLGIVLSDNSNTSLKSTILKQINDDYQGLLKQNLKNEHYPLDDHFTYNWTNPSTKKQINIDYSFIPTGVDLQSSGMSLTYVSRIKDDQHWHCGKPIPTQQLNPQIYGGIQEFISFSIISNTVRYSYEKGYLDTHLSRQNWQSRLFQFFAGDLYEVIPAVASKYYASQQVNGNCSFNPDHEVEVKRVSQFAFNVTTDHLCSLYIVNQKIAQFTLLLQSQVSIFPQPNYLNFRITATQQDVDFRKVVNYQVQNLELAKMMVQHSLRRLKQNNVIGSGWKIFPRDYPHVLVFDDYLAIYDSTHVATYQ